MKDSDILRKIRKLKKKLKRNQTSSSSESESESETISDVVVPPPRKRMRIESSDSDSPTSIVQREETIVHEDDSEDIIASILGEDPTFQKELGDDIHPHIAIRWNNILQKGLKKENRSDLINKYLPPANCSLIRAPRLNDEIKAASQENAIKRDSKLEQKQSQLGAGITSIGKAMDLALKIPDKDLKSNLVKYIGDSGQILSDLHYLESITRRSLLSQSLNKNTKDAIKDLPRDHLLFGEGLADKLKAAKACTKSVADIKLKAKTPVSRSRIENRPTTSYNAPVSLNWRGSSRRPAASAHHSLSAGSYRERRPVTAPAPQASRRAQTSQRHHKRS